MDETTSPLEQLTERAVELGADATRIIPAESILVEDHFALMCEPPQCDGYGLSANCPPHVMRPGEFRECLRQYKHALVFRLDVPMEILLADERRDVNRLLHDIAASIERFAIDSGYPSSRGLAAGCCKQLFCDEYDGCNVLDEGGECRFPDLSRPSMSGLGVNCLELNRALGRQSNRSTGDGEADDAPMGMMTGMVLIGA